jgi:hypothetical protein
MMSLQDAGRGTATTVTATRTADERRVRRFTRGRPAASADRSIAQLQTADLDSVPSILS